MTTVNTGNSGQNYALQGAASAQPQKAVNQKQAVAKPDALAAPETLSKIIDKNILADIQNAKMNPVDSQLKFGQEPTDFTQAKLSNEGKNIGKLTMTPVGEDEKPKQYMLNGKDNELTVHLGKGKFQLSGIGVLAWPPESVKFTDPDSGKIVNGFRVELSSGDELFIPKGVNVNINNKTINNDQFNQVVDYHISALGIMNIEMGPASRYASVFALRQ